jgi:HAD superfamily hydrolase (TIGR01509 family)
MNTLISSAQLIIFDCDGVLVDSERLTAEVLREMLAEMAIDITTEDIFEHYVGTPFPDALKMIAKTYDLTLPDNFIEVFNQRSLMVLEKNLQPIPGIKALLEQLSLPFALASNSRPEKVRAMLKFTELLHKFEGKIFTASQVKRPKPAPDVYLLAAKTYNVKPAACLVIEDSVVGVKAAKSAGMTVYGYAAATKPQRLWDAGADKVFSQMSDLGELLNSSSRPRHL